MSPVALVAPKHSIPKTFLEKAITTNIMMLVIQHYKQMFYVKYYTITYCIVGNIDKYKNDCNVNFIAKSTAHDRDTLIVIFIIEK